MTKQARAELALFATTFIWGSTFVVARSVSSEISPSLYIFLRFAIGTLLFTSIFFHKLKGIQLSTVKKGVILGIMLGIGIIIQNIGIYQTTASKSAFITGLMVIFTPIAQLIIEKRAPKVGNLLGIIIVTIGLFLLTSPNGSEINTGDWLVLISAAIFGVFIVYMDIFSKNENPVQLSFIQIASTTFIALLFLPFENIHFSNSATLLGLILYIGFFATVITTYSQTRFQKDTTPTRAVIIFTIEPVIASVLAYFILKEEIGTSGIVGGTLIISGILVSEFLDGFTQKLGFKVSAIE